jgi:hypothetical protein
LVALQTQSLSGILFADRLKLGKIFIHDSVILSLLWGLLWGPRTLEAYQILRLKSGQVPMFPSLLLFPDRDSGTLFFFKAKT